MSDDQYLNLIKGLSKAEFDTFVKSFLKEYYETNQVILADGPYDGGLDVVVHIGEKTIKRNIQVSIQKKDLDGKIISDVEKSSDNVKEYNYQKSLDFYSNQKFTNSKILKLKKEAEVQFGIELEIYDANYFANQIDDISILKSILQESVGVKVNKPFEITKDTKILFDVLTQNSDVTNIKNGFIDSYILSYLYTNEPSHYEKVAKALNPQLNNKFDPDFFRNRLNNLKSAGKVSSHENNDTFKLNDGVKKEIKEIDTNSEKQEKALELKLSSVLNEYNINELSSELINLIRELYKANYELDFDELTAGSSSFNSSLKKIYHKLENYFLKKGLSNDDAPKCTRELLTVLSKDDYLNKLSVTVLFSNLFNHDKLEKYIESKPQYLLIDTQILIRYLCVLYLGTNRSLNVNDTSISTTAHFFKTLEKHRKKVFLSTSSDYIEETALHIIQALKLERFLSIPSFSKFGSSKNVYFNYYNYLKNNDLLKKNETLKEFLESLLNIDFNNIDSYGIQEDIYDRIRQYLELKEYEIIDHEFYPNFQELKKEYELILMDTNRSRSYYAIEHDLKTALFLSERDYHIDSHTSVLNEPFLITWDSAFYDLRNAMKKFTGRSFWYIYSPLKYTDRLSVSNFSLDPQSINYNIIALAETNFKYYSSGTSFIDAISIMFNYEDLDELEVIQKLADLETQTKKHSSKESEEQTIDHQFSPVGELLIDLRSHYKSNDSSYSFEDLISLFEEENYIDKLIELFEKNVYLYVDGKESKETIFLEFDSLIKETKI